MDICLERILKLMDEKNVTNADLVSYLGCSYSSVSEWKKGKISSYRKYIAEISTLLDVSTDYLLGKNNIRNINEWNELITNYTLCDADNKELANRLLGIECEKGIPKSISHGKEEDMSAIVELVSIFDKLNLLGKTKVLSAAMEELNNEK